MLMLLPSPDATLLLLLAARARGIEVPAPTAIEEASGDWLKEGLLLILLMLMLLSSPDATLLLLLTACARRIGVPRRCRCRQAKRQRDERGPAGRARTTPVLALDETRRLELARPCRRRECGESCARGARGVRGAFVRPAHEG